MVVVNEQSATNGVKHTAGTINAIHAFVYRAIGNLTAEVIVGHAHSDAHHP
ncbi:MAG: choice-of-anchor P family protein [Acidimicrobiales bacterium]